MPNGIPRKELLLVEKLKATCHRVEKDPNEPSASGFSCLQQPVILDADRLSPDLQNAEDGSPFQECQIDGLLRIFEVLTIKERVRLSQTCRRFHQLLTDKKSCPIRGLTVLNMFQKKVWEDSVRKNAISSLTMIKLSKMEHIVSLFRHIRKIDCVKIWYLDTNFVKTVLDAFDESIQVRNIDVFPYGSDIELDKVNEVFPKARALTMRPHGTAYFFEGQRISSMPNFAHLSYLSMDSFEPLPGFAFPSSVKNLDFAHRKLRDMRCLFKALEQLNLSYLSLSHLKFNSNSSIEAFIWSISKMKRIETLVMKFCHLGTMDGIELPSGCEPCGKDESRSREFDKSREDSGALTLSLSHINFDLCYDVSWPAMCLFADLSRKSLSNFSISLLYEDEQQFNSLLRLTPMLNSQNVCLSFSVMQKDTKKEDEIKPPPELPAEFHHVISRFEASYLLLPDLLLNTFVLLCKNLTQCKFVCSRGLNDDVLRLMSVNCPYLKKLNIISCGEVTEEGLQAFVTNISTRKTASPLNAIDSLQILYKNNTINLILNVYGQLLLEGTEEHQTVHYRSKTFPEGGSVGECLLFKDQLLNRSVIYKNYTPEDSNHLLGLVIDAEEEMNWSQLLPTFDCDHDSPAVDCDP